MIDIVVHLGAHRTGTTSLQQYLKRVEEASCPDSDAFTFLGPDFTRSGQLDKLFRQADDHGHLAQETAEKNAILLAERMKAIKSNGGKLILSEENFLGTMEECYTQSTMYPNLVTRLERFRIPFEEAGCFLLTIRSTADWWRSCFSYLVRLGYPIPDKHGIKRIVANERSWAQIVAELRSLFPDTPLVIRDFNSFKSKPKRQMIQATQWDMFSHSKNFGHQSNQGLSEEELRGFLSVQHQDDALALLDEVGLAHFPFSPAQTARLTTRFFSDLEIVNSELRENDRLIYDPRSHLTNVSA